MGCSTLGYLYQAGKGQLELFNKARPISEVLKDERTPPEIKTLLEQIDPVKRFSESQGLKPTRNYTEYVKLDRSAAVWVVSACEPLLFESKVWKFPIVGEFPYLGWFDKGSAESFADDLRKTGLDVDVRPASAYSTLGWFRDAVLSTMISKGEDAFGGLVNVIIHESVHATLYIRGQAYFNESLANFVADKMTPLYLDQFGASTQEKESYLQAEAKGKERVARMHSAYLALRDLYASNQTAQAKQLQKEKVLSQLKADLGTHHDMNNATLIQYKTYNEGMPEFEAIYNQCGRNLRKFMARLGTLKEESFPKRQDEDLSPVLGPLAKGNC